MACHTINIAAMALELFDPESIEVVDTSGIVDHESYPVWSIIRTRFGPRNGRGPVTLTWFDGGDKLPEDKRTYKELLHGEVNKKTKKIAESGLLLVGEKGSFFSENDYGAEHVLLPRDKFKEVKKPKPTLPRSPGHFNEWVDAIKAGDPNKAMSNFDYAGRLTETVLLGVVALKAGTHDRVGPRGHEGQERPVRRPVHPARLPQGLLDPRLIEARRRVRLAAVDIDGSHHDRPSPDMDQYVAGDDFAAGDRAQCPPGLIVDRCS